MTAPTATTTEPVVIIGAEPFRVAVTAVALSMIVRVAW